MRSADYAVFDYHRYTIGTPVDRSTLPLTVAFGDPKQHVFVICSFSCLFYSHTNKAKWDFSYTHSDGVRIVFTII
jgi:hypothetical protein